MTQPVTTSSAPKILHIINSKHELSHAQCNTNVYN